MNTRPPAKLFRAWHLAERDRFLLFNHTDQFDSSIQQLSKWLKEGKIKAQETITRGLENTPGAFLSMMTGGNTGKQIVQVSQ